MYETWSQFVRFKTMADFRFWWVLRSDREIVSTLERHRDVILPMIRSKSIFDKVASSAQTVFRFPVIWKGETESELRSIVRKHGFYVSSVFGVELDSALDPSEVNLREDPELSSLVDSLLYNIEESKSKPIRETKDPCMEALGYTSEDHKTRQLRQRASMCLGNFWEDVVRKIPGMISKTARSGIDSFLIQDSEVNAIEIKNACNTMNAASHKETIRRLMEVEQVGGLPVTKRTLLIINSAGDTVSNGVRTVSGNVFFLEHLGVPNFIEKVTDVIKWRRCETQ